MPVNSSMSLTYWSRAKGSSAYTRFKRIWLILRNDAGGHQRIDQALLALNLHRSRTKTS
jgi:hypothetical protein